MSKEVTLKTKISRFAEWVPVDVHEHVNRIYGQYIKRYKHSLSNHTNDEYLLHAANAFEMLARHEVFKEIWEKFPNSIPVSELSNIFGTYELVTPRIKRSETENYISDIQKALKKISDIVSIDPSITTCFEVAYDSTLIKYLKPRGHYANESVSDTTARNNPFATADSFPFILNGHSLTASSFFLRLQEELKAQKMRTHIFLPKKMNDPKLSERCYFSLKISKFIMFRLRQVNHKKAAEILNTIRPDLGRFTANGISKIVNGSALKEDCKIFLR